jgi:thiamine transport system permease protein
MSAVIYAFLVAVFVLAPMLSIIVKTFLTKASQVNGMQLTLRWYKELFGYKTATGGMGEALPAIRNSLIIAAVVALLSMPLSLMIATGAKRQHSLSASLIELLGMLPMAISSVIIGLGYYLIAARIHGNGFIMVVLAHLIISLPFVLRTVTPELRKLPQALNSSAQTLGATPFQAFLTVEIPLLRNALISGAIFAFALSMGEINATLTLASSHLVTLPIVMYRLIGSYNYNGACALGTILIAVCAVVFVTSEHTKRLSI